MSVIQEPVDTARAPDVAAGRSARTGPHLGFRPDIEGMRAIAVTLVVLSHAGLATLAGGYVGVDVFFVISGFLITTLLLKELGRTGTVSLTRFYARRAIRLLPASALVLVATLAGAWFWLPSTRFHSISLDALFATFYGINWRLADEGVQYLNADAAPSPLQHFWSLAVEEQFYLVWPLLMLIYAFFWARSRRPRSAVVIPTQRTSSSPPPSPVRPKHRFLTVALILIAAASLAASMTQTRSAAPWAYFGAHTRAWELAIGALVAVAASRLAVLPGRVAAPLTWLGMAAVIGSAFLYDEHTAFPGSAALLPVLGSAAIIAAGCAAPRGGAAVVLRTRPFQLIGRYSYSWYLWHWPILMIGPAALGLESSLGLGLALAAGSLVVAVASYHLIENPVRNRQWIKARARRGLAVGLALSAVTAGLALGAGRFTPAVATGDAVADTSSRLAEAADAEARLRTLLADASRQLTLPANLKPAPEAAAADQPVIYRDGCHIDYPFVAAGNPCAYGDTTATDSIFLLGDSHAAHWFPAVDAIAKERDLKLFSRTKAACQAASVLVFNDVLKRPYSECVEWRDRVFAEIAAQRPKFVVLSSNGGDSGGLVTPDNKPLDRGPDRDRLWVQAWTRTFDTIERAGAQPVLLLDTPWPAGSAPECVVTRPTAVNECARPAREAFVEPGRREMVAAAARARGVTVVDTRDWFCTSVSCPAVVGNLLVWKDSSHISTAYAAMLTPLLDARLPS
ncbi:acyltransferase [Actinoplanes sp. OR16]|uniref:acyltransferase family protein n=1 Tax=Actinoplanes sp. OR16 TaxID=946334 RepID=UPI000F6D1291|nr:acyltransferase family protein [Actinoplanes sp. OR16]BBH63591.1 acyltransferase [Actinoplanes sp. OR16]